MGWALLESDAFFVAYRAKRPLVHGNGGKAIFADKSSRVGFWILGLGTNPAAEREQTIKKKGKEAVHVKNPLSLTIPAIRMLLRLAIACALGAGTLLGTELPTPTRTMFKDKRFFET